MTPMMFLAQEVFNAYAIISSSMTAVFTSLDLKTITNISRCFPIQLLFLLYPYLSSPNFQADNATSYANVCKTQIVII